jgi:hypothetical protein
MGNLNTCDVDLAVETMSTLCDLRSEAYFCANVTIMSKAKPTFLYTVFYT